MTGALIALALKVTFVLLVTLATSALLHRRSAATRHWILTVGVACAIAMPALTLIAPLWLLPGAPGLAGPDASSAVDGVTFTLLVPDGAAASPNEARVETATSMSTLRAVLVALWAAGSLMALGSLATGLLRLRALSRRAAPAPAEWVSQARDVAKAYGVRTPVEVRQTRQPALLVTWGARRAEVLLPPGAAAWPPDRIRSVVAHELAHVARGDWTVQLLAETLRALCWWHPLAWLVLRRLRVEAERACDDCVLALGIPHTDYAAHLLAVAHAFHGTRRPWLPAPAIDRPSTLQTRIRAMLNTQLDRRPPTASSRLAVTLALLLATVSVAGATRQPAAMVTGAVTDPSGRPIPGVALALTALDRPFRTELRSDRNGAYEFTGLPQGRYRLESRFPAFQPTTTELTVGNGAVVHQPLALVVGTLRETINLTGQVAPAAAIQTAPRPAPAPCTVSSTGGQVVPPMKIRDVRPTYPTGLVEATVVQLEARIGFDGRVAAVRAMSPAPFELTRAGTDAVWQWEFTPTLLNCEPVEVTMHVTITFAPQP